MVKIFLDTADIDEIREAASWGVLDGVTTNPSLLAKETGDQTTSAAAAAIWFPYDTEPMEKVIPWALETYHALVDLARDPGSGVSMIELRQCSRVGEIQIPEWALSLGAVPSAGGPAFTDAFAMTGPVVCWNRTTNSSSPGRPTASHRERWLAQNSELPWDHSVQYDSAHSG